MVLKESHIDISCPDKCLELTTPSWAVALSSLSLVDGYFRPTAHSSHCLYYEVVAPRLEMPLWDSIHGPLLQPFVLATLQPKDGLCFSHWSISHLNHLIPQWPGEPGSQRTTLAPAYVPH